MSDAYNYIPSFFSDDPKGGALTYEQLQARRKIAAAIATRNRPFPKTIGEGLTYLGESLGENYADRRAAADEARYRQQSQATVQQLLQGGGGPAAPAAAPAAPVAPVPPAGAGAGPMDPEINPFGPAFAAPQAQATEQTPPDVAKISPVMQALAPGGATADRQPLTPQQAAQQPKMSIDEWKQRIARNESGGRKDAYTLVGERSKRGDYPYGKYQVMGENIPKWTKGYLGREMTPQEFLADPDAQEQVATARGGEYLTKYGPNGAAAAWFAGEQGMNDPKRKDTLGTHVAEYTRRFNIPVVSREQVVASAGGMPPSVAAAFGPDESGMGGAPPVQLASLGGAPTPDTQSGAGTLVGGPPKIGEGVPYEGPIPTGPFNTRDAITQQVAGPPPAPQQVAQAQPPIGRPVPTQVAPINAGPPPAPQQTPMSPHEIRLRQAASSSADPRIQGQLLPVIQQMEEQRKFEDARKVKQWEADLATYKSGQDPVHKANLEKMQREAAAAERERIKLEARGGVPQSVIDKGVEASVKIAAPLREASVGINQIEDLLEKGMFTGTLGKVDLAIAKAKQAVGGAVDPRVARTEQFTSSVKPIVAAARAALAGGANISDRDMQAAEQAAGGDITLTKEGLQSIMQSIRTVQLQTALHHQQTLGTAAGGDTAAERTLYGLHGLPMEQIVPKNHPATQRLLQNADSEHERGLFDKAFHTPGLADRIIARNRR